jgi:hypothetical protein
VPQIREYLEKKYTKVEPFPSMFILNNYDGFETTKQICDDIITDMYAVKGLTYTTLEKEDPTLDNPNTLRIFSYTRGLDFPSPKFIDDLIEVKYGERLRFSGKKVDLNTILAWQSPGIWKTGVQFLEYELEHDMVDEVVIEAAIEFSEKSAIVISSITIEDLWLLKSGLKRVTITEAMKVFENLHARYFEICVQELLRAKYGYSNVITRYKPPYLKGKEIDVYARKGMVGERKAIIICECKLRFEKREIQLEEIADFPEVALEVRQHELELTAEEGGSSKIEAWLVTNSIVSPDALETLRKNDIRVIIAKLPSNWRKRGDWKIIEIEECR